MKPATHRTMARAALLATLVTGLAATAAADVPAATTVPAEPRETTRESSPPAATPRDAAASARAVPEDRVAAAPGRAREDAVLARRLVDELELDAIAITGNDELPSIMHIVPWKSAQPGEVPGRPADSLINDIVAPLDRREYRRQLRYREALAESSSDR